MQDDNVEFLSVIEKPIEVSNENYLKNWNIRIDSIIDKIKNSDNLEEKTKEKIQTIKNRLEILILLKTSNEYKQELNKYKKLVLKSKIEYKKSLIEAGERSARLKNFASSQLGIH